MLRAILILLLTVLMTACSKLYTDENMQQLEKNSRSALHQCGRDNVLKVNLQGFQCRSSSYQQLENKYKTTI